jgi:hypothetical protein
MSNKSPTLLWSVEDDRGVSPLVGSSGTIYILLRDNPSFRQQCKLSALVAGWTPCDLFLLLLLVPSFVTETKDS